MADIELSVSVDSDGAESDLRNLNRTLNREQNTRTRSERQTNDRRVREEARTQARITTAQDRANRNRDRTERRLRRIRRRNSVRFGRQRIREENRLQREADRLRERQSRERQRRRAAIGGGIRTGVTGAAGLGVGVVGLGIASIFDAGEILSFKRNLAVTSGAAGLTAADQEALGNKIDDISVSTGADANALLLGVESVLEKSGDINLAVEQLDRMAQAQIGLNAEMVDSGRLIAALSTKFGIESKKMAGAFDLIIAQGDQGQIVFKDFANIAEDIFSSAAAFGVKGKSGVNAVSALIQSSVGSADERKTIFSSFLSELISKRKVITKKTGFDPFDKEGKAKDLDAIVKGIVKGSKGDIFTLKSIFGDTALRQLSNIALAFRETKKFGDLDKFLGLGAGSEGLLKKRFGRVEETGSVAIDKFTNLVGVLGEASIEGSIESLTTFLEQLRSNPEKLEAVAKGFSTIGDVLTTLTKTSLLAVSAFGKVGDAFEFLAGLVFSDRSAASFNTPTETFTRTGVGGGILSGTAPTTKVTNILSLKGQKFTGRTIVEQNDPSTGRTIRTGSPF